MRYSPWAAAVVASLLACSSDDPAGLSCDEDGRMFSEQSDGPGPAETADDALRSRIYGSGQDLNDFDRLESSASEVVFVSRDHKDQYTVRLNEDGWEIAGAEHCPVGTPKSFEETGP
jgi:hypothetical protein